MDNIARVEEFQGAESVINNDVQMVFVEVTRATFYKIFHVCVESFHDNEKMFII